MPRPNAEDGDEVDGAEDNGEITLAHSETSCSEDFGISMAYFQSLIAGLVETFRRSPVKFRAVLLHSKPISTEGWKGVLSPQSFPKRKNSHREKKDLLAILMLFVLLPESIVFCKLQRHSFQSGC